MIDNINNEKALSYVATSPNTGFALLHRKIPKLVALSPGTLVEIGCAVSDGPPSGSATSEARSLSGLYETISGTLVRKADKDFALILTARGLFVPAALAKTFALTQKYDVFCYAIRRINKQGKTGWRSENYQARAEAALRDTLSER